MSPTVPQAAPTWLDRLPAPFAGLGAALVVLWPAPPSWGITGIPLDRWLAGVWVGGALLVPCAAAMCLPRTWPSSTSGQPHRGRASIATGTRILRTLIPVSMLAAALGVVLKCTLLLLPAPGFEACLRLPAPATGQACERSWAYPLNDEITRMDVAIDVPVADGLSRSDWRLSAANATQYNYFTPAQPNRDRLALAGRWHGRLADNASPMTVTYVGEGSITIDGTTIDLPASYTAASSVVLPAGSDIRIDYAWRSEATNADGPQTSPYAALSLTTPAGQPALSADPSGLARALAVTAELLVVITVSIVALLVAGFLTSNRRAIRASVSRSAGRSAPWAWALLAASAAAILAMGRLQAAAVYPLGIVVLLLAMSALLRATPVPVVRVLSAIAIGAAALAMTTSLTRGTPLLTLRSGGSDPLTYEGQAHALLMSGSLHGGESVFIYSPAFRYLIALKHLVVGDTDRAFVTLGVAGLLAGCVFACWMLLRPLRDSVSPPSFGRLLGIVGAIGLLGLFVGSPDVILGSRTLLSEYPTWIGLLFAVPLVLAGRRGWSLVIGALLIGLVLTCRGDQLPGLLMLLAIALIRQWRSWTSDGERHTAAARAQSLRWTMATLGAFVIPAALPAVHNIVYGRQLVLLQTSIPLPVNFPLPPSTWPLVLHDPDLQRTLVEQVAGVLVILGVHPEGIASPLFVVAVRGIQAAAVVVVLIAAIRRFRGGWRRVIVLVIPLAFLVPHIFIQVYVYYPRHVVAGYLVAAISLLALAGWSIRQPAITTPSMTTSSMTTSSMTGPARDSRRSRNHPRDPGRAG